MGFLPWCRLCGALVLAAAVIASSGTARRVYPRDLHNIPAAVSAAVASGDDVTVIIGLAVDGGFQPEGTLAAPGVLQQRARIALAQDGLAALLATAGITRVSRFRTIPLVSARINATALALLRSSPAVTSIQENHRLSTSLLESTAVIGAPIQWARGNTGVGSTIAIIDTGVDGTHPFLSGKVVSEACYSNDGGMGTGSSVCPDAQPSSIAPGSGAPCSAAVAGCEHGTLVAGAAAGRGPTFSGVAPDASIIAIQSATQFGGRVEMLAADVLRGLERVYELRTTFRIAAVNLSLSGDRYSAHCDLEWPAYKLMFDTLTSAGIAVVVASGNDGFTGSLRAPACITSAVSVGSTTDGSEGTAVDQIDPTSNVASFLSFLAPGTHITSSMPGGGFASVSGTSMAAAHVSGAWAIYRQRSPDASHPAILNELRTRATMIAGGGLFPRLNLAPPQPLLCTYSVSPTTIQASRWGDRPTVYVTAPDDCHWGVGGGSASSWVSVVEGVAGTGNGIVTFEIPQNLGFSRTGTMTVAGVTVTVAQVGQVISTPFVSDPVGGTVTPGQTWTMTVTGFATGQRHPPLSFAWYIGQGGDTSTPVSGGSMSIIPDGVRYTTPPLSKTTSYWVRLTAGAPYDDSATATVVVDYGFTDTTLIAGVSPVRAIHIAELRERIDALRARYELADFVWTDSPLRAGGSVLRAQHIVELRAALHAAYVAAKRSPPTYTDSALTPEVTRMSAGHIIELRDAVVALE